jgi:hypothetical protein
LRFAVGAVDHGTLRNHAGIYQHVEQPEPEVTARPAVEPIVDRRGWPVIGRAVALAIQHMHDTKDHPRSPTRCTPSWFCGRCGLIAAHADGPPVSHLDVMRGFGLYDVSGPVWGSGHRTGTDIRSHDCHPRRWPSLLLRWPRDQRSH